MSLFTTMEEILSIGPDEWEKVAEAYSVEFLGQDVDSLQRKYTEIYRKKVQTSNLNMPEEVRLSKKVKSIIWNRSQLGGGEEE